jgi:hypothetical protein
LESLDTMFILLFHFLQFLPGLLLVGFLVSFGCRGFAEGILRLADHQELGIRVINELGFQRNPSEISELL